MAQNGNGKRTVKLSDDTEVVLDMYKLKASHIQKWATFKDNVPSEEIIKALSIVSGLEIAAINDMPVPDFLPLNQAFGEMLTAYTQKATTPDPN